MRNWRRRGNPTLFRRTLLPALLVLPAVATGLLSGCTSALRGGDEDLSVHLEMTYGMARAAGFDADDAAKIAASDYYTDEHPETNSVATERRLVAGIAHPLVLPSVFFSAVFDWTTGRETPCRALGANLAAYTAWSLSTLAHKLHFPAESIHDPTSPAFGKDVRGEALYVRNHDAVTLLEQAFLSIEVHDQDRGRTLALLGIALHVLQDSYKHASYSATRGHIGVHPTPDDLRGDPALACEIAEATFLSLRHARLRMEPANRAPAADWQTILRDVFDPSRGEPSDGEGRWRSVLRSIFGDAPEPWPALRSSWQASGGEDDFERALEKVKRLLR